MRAVVGAVLLFGGCDEAPVDLSPAGAAGAAGSAVAGSGGQSADLPDDAARKDAAKQAAFEAWLRAAWPTTAR